MAVAARRDEQRLRPVMREIETLLRDFGAWDEPYDRLHLKRYAATSELLREKLPAGLHRARVLAVGEKGAIPLILMKRLGVRRLEANSIGPDARSLELQSRATAERVRIDIRDVNVEEETWPYASESFDLVVCFEVLEHLERDPAFFVLEAHRVLRPGGRIALTTPNSSSFRSLVAILSGKDPLLFSVYGYGPISHAHEYSVEQLHALFTGGGFHIEEHSTFGAYDGFGNEEQDARYARLRVSLETEHGLKPRNLGNTHFLLAARAGRPEWRRRYPVYAPEFDERFTEYPVKPPRRR